MLLDGLGGVVGVGWVVKGGYGQLVRGVTSFMTTMATCLTVVGGAGCWPPLLHHTHPGTPPHAPTHLREVGVYRRWGVYRGGGCIWGGCI